MAITIIGEKQPTERTSASRPEADLPRPSSAPAAERTLSREQIAPLFDHENPLVRAFAVEQTRARTGGEAGDGGDAGDAGDSEGRKGGEDWTDALIAKVADPHPAVAMEAIMRLDERRAVRGVDAIAARFAASNGDVAAVAAKALGRLAPERLLNEVKKRGRLDDEAYAATATALAVVASPDVVEFLDQAMNRAGALHAERRVALYGAALLSGDAKLATRALTLAVRDSKEAEPENASFPTRAALAAISGLPMVASRRESGLELYDHMREILEKDAERILPDANHREALLEALKIKRPNFILECLIPVLKVELAAQPSSAQPQTTPQTLDGPESLGTLPKRRQGLLAALIEQRNAIGSLELPSAALFLVVATQAVEVILAGAKRPEGTGAAASDTALIALSKALEGQPSAEALEAMSLEAATEFFKARSPRDMRRLLGVMSREKWTTPATRRRFLEAIAIAGHAGMLFQAASETDETPFHQTTFDVAEAHLAETEDAIVEALDETPIERRKALFLLALIDRVRTTRVALAVGRASAKLNAHDRSATTRTLLRLADERLLPLLEARAFRDEPEEAAFLILSLVHKKEVTGRLKEILERGANEAFADKPHLRLMLKCKRCSEIFTYRIEHVHLDIEAKDEFGDPVFVGEIACKACKAEDALEPTPESGRIIANHMLAFLSAARTGQLTAPPLVTPSQTSVLGRKVGFGAGLRALNEAIEKSPDGVRTRIQRARIRMILERPGVEDDADAALTIDPNAVEGKALKAAARARAQDFETAMRLLGEAWHLVQEDAPGRIYETDDRKTFASGLEDNMLSLTHYAAAPAEIDLGPARARAAEREAEEEALLAAQERAEEEAEAQARSRGPQAHQGARSMANDDAIDEDDVDDAHLGRGTSGRGASAIDRFRNVGRNDACPCGSGKKFKKCHGATANR